MTEEMEGPYELPAGWVWTTLGEIAELIGGGTPSRERPEYFGGDIVWLTPTEIPKDRVAVVTESKEHITQEGQRKSSARFVPKGSVLMTSRASIGYVAIAGTEVTTNQGFASFINSGAVHNSYLAYWLWSQRDSFIQQATGTTFKEITKSKLRPIAFPIAPLPEQLRIVAKIEELLTSLDAGVASLKRIKAGLKRYRAAVLKAACEGRLVPQDPNDEPAEKLLERILAERRAKWEADSRAKGKDPKKAKYEEPKGPDAEGLAELPTGWCWATVEQLSTKVVDGVHKKPNYVADGIPFVTVRNLTAGPGIDFSQLNHITVEDHKEFVKRANPERGDILISKDGTLGVIRVVRTDRQFSIFVSVAMIKPALVEMSGFLGIAMSSWQVQKQMVPKGSGLQHIHLEDLRVDCIPVPPIFQQQRIVAEVERRLSVVGQLEKTVEANLVRAERLRQAILRRAFEGKLVGQEAGDEPRSALLERTSAQGVAGPS